MTADTLDALLERARAVPGTGLRFLDRRERETFVSWSAIHRRASEVGAALQALGIRPGERVALVFPTGPDFLAALFGVLLAGAVPVPLYPPVRLGRLDEYHVHTARMIEVSGSRAVLADRRVRQLLGEAAGRARPPLGCRTLAELVDLAVGRAAAPVAVDPDDLALVQFSSGTTLDPKPVALSHRAVVAQVRLLNGFWPDDGSVEHAGVSWLPLYHDMGLIGCVFTALERPATSTLIAPEVFLARPAVWLRALSRYRATVSPAPNFAYGLCVQRIRDEELSGVDLSCWRHALCGAEPVAPSVLRAFRERFARFGLRPEALTPVYGLAEAALAVTFGDLDRPFDTRRFDGDRLAEEGEAVPAAGGRELVSVGRPLPCFDVRIRAGSGIDVPDSTVGRIHVRGPSLMRGYLDQSERTAHSLRDGWLDTGDVGFLHDGDLYLTGRAKDILIVRGRNHAPEEIEHAADGVPEVRTGCSAAASWMSESDGREAVVLFVEHTQDATTDAIAALADACARAVRQSAGLELDEVVVLEPGTLPRTSSGKIRRQETVRRHRSGALAPPERVTTFAMLRAIYRSRRALARLARESRGAGA